MKTYDEDWSYRSSPDQNRMTEWFKNKDLSNKKILHIGIGDSSFALSIAANKIDGITISQIEIDNAKQLNIKNYDIYYLDKYSFLLNNLPNTYDYIVDNNMFNFTSCNICIANYFYSLVQLLNIDGQIITDTGGMFLEGEQQWTINKFKDLIQELNLPLSITEYEKEKSQHFFYVIGLKKTHEYKNPFSNCTS